MFMMPAITARLREETGGKSPFKGAIALLGLTGQPPKGTDSPVPEVIEGGNFLPLLQILSDGLGRPAAEGEAVPPDEARGLTATTGKDGVADIAEAGYARSSPVSSAALSFPSVVPEGSAASGREALPGAVNGPMMPAPMPGRKSAPMPGWLRAAATTMPAASPNPAETLRPFNGLTAQGDTYFYGQTDAAVAGLEPGAGHPILDSQIPALAGRAVYIPGRGPDLPPPAASGEANDPGRPEAAESGGTAVGNKEIPLPGGGERPMPALPAGREAPVTGRQLTAPGMILRAAAPLSCAADPASLGGAPPQEEMIPVFNNDKDAPTQPPAVPGRNVPGRAGEKAVPEPRPGESDDGTMVEDKAPPLRREVLAYIGKEERIAAGQEAAGNKGKTILDDSGVSIGGPPANKTGGPSGNSVGGPVNDTAGPPGRGKLPRPEIFAVPESRDDHYAAGGVPLFREQGIFVPEVRSLPAQVAEQLPQALGAGSGRVKISLRPDHLGKLDVDVLLRGNKVQIVLTADNREVQQVLQAHREQLKEALQQQGVQVDGFSVLLHDGRPGQGDASGRGQAPGWEHDGAAGGKGVLPEEAILPETVSGLARLNGRSGEEAVNLFV